MHPWFKAFTAGPEECRGLGRIPLWIEGTFNVALRQRTGGEDSRTAGVRLADLVLGNLLEQGGGVRCERSPDLDVESLFLRAP